jgi:hypothetical protein
VLVMVAFVLVSGVDDAGNAIAASVVTGTIRAGRAAVLGALVWSLVTLRWAHPRSSGHCLVSAFGSLLWLFFSSAIVVPLAILATYEEANSPGAKPWTRLPPGYVRPPPGRRHP